MSILWVKSDGNVAWKLLLHKLSYCLVSQSNYLISMRQYNNISELLDHLLNSRENLKIPFFNFSFSFSAESKRNYIYFMILIHNYYKFCLKLSYISVSYFKKWHNLKNCFSEKKKNYFLTWYKIIDKSNNIGKNNRIFFTWPNVFYMIKFLLFSFHNLQKTISFSNCNNFLNKNHFFLIWRFWQFFYEVNSLLMRHNNTRNNIYLTHGIIIRKLLFLVVLLLKWKSDKWKLKPALKRRPS